MSSSPGYMAPEVFRKTGHGKPVDVWAIGVIAYFLCAGYTPFDRESQVEEVQAICSANYSYTPTEYWSAISDTARDFIDKCLVVDPAKRLTAKQCMQHEWLVSDASASHEGQEDLLSKGLKAKFDAKKVCPTCALFNLYIDRVVFLLYSGVAQSSFCYTVHQRSWQCSQDAQVGNPYSRSTRFRGRLAKGQGTRRQGGEGYGSVKLLMIVIC